MCSDPEGCKEASDLVFVLRKPTMYLEKQDTLFELNRVLVKAVCLSMQIQVPESSPEPFHQLAVP